MFRIFKSFRCVAQQKGNYQPGFQDNLVCIERKHLIRSFLHPSPKTRASKTHNPKLLFRIIAAHFLQIYQVVSRFRKHSSTVSNLRKIGSILLNLIIIHIPLLGAFKHYPIFQVNFRWVNVKQEVLGFCLLVNESIDSCSKQMQFGDKHIHYLSPVPSIYTEF